MTGLYRTVLNSSDLAASQAAQDAATAQADATHGSAGVGHLPGGTGARAVTVRDQLNLFASNLNDSASPDRDQRSTLASAATIEVNHSRTTINCHAFGTGCHLNTIDTGVGYSSYDAQCTLNNALAQDHFHSYQARQVFSGSGNLNSLYGFWAVPTHNGSGTIANYIGARITDLAGHGPVTSAYGLFIDPITRGSTNNYSIWLNGGKLHAVDLIEGAGGVSAPFFSSPYSQITGPTYTATNETYLSSTYPGVVTLTLPSAAAFPGRRIMVKTTTAWAINSPAANVYPLQSYAPSTQIVSGAAGKWAELVSDGVAWVTMASGG